MLLQNFEKLIILVTIGNTANYFLKTLKKKFEGEIAVVSRDKNKFKKLLFYNDYYLFIN